MALDTSGTRCFAAFLVEVTQAVPDAVLPALSVLLPHLSGEVLTINYPCLELHILLPPFLSSSLPHFPPFLSLPPSSLLPSLSPSLLSPSLSLHHKSYTMRNGVLGVMGEIVSRVFSSPEIDEQARVTRNQLLDKLEEHLHDVNAFVRSKTLQIWLQLFNKKVRNNLIEIVKFILTFPLPPGYSFATAEGSFGVGGWTSQGQE